MPITMVLFHDTNISTTATSSTASSTTATSTPASTPSTLGDYEFVSCWAEPEDGSRTLVTVYGADDMTNEKCAGLCGGSLYIGTQWSRECWCGPSLATGSAEAPSTDCSYVCDGDATEICGGSRRLSLYKLKSSSSSSSSVTSTTSSQSSTDSSSSSTSSSTSTDSTTSTD